MLLTGHKPTYSQGNSQAVNAHIWCLEYTGHYILPQLIRLLLLYTAFP